ncbi:MAG: 4-alpha-glucanotransferase [Glaciecola sp.]
MAPQHEQTSAQHSQQEQAQLIDYLIEQRGIGSDFVDAWGKPAVIKAENQQTLLRAMGYNIEDGTMLTAQVEDELVERWLRPLAPVIVVRKGEELSISIRVSIEAASTPHTFKFELENGATETFKFIPVDHTLICSQEINDIEWQEYLVVVPQINTLGYHGLKLMAGRKIIGRASFIIAPQKCYIPTSIQQGRKIWGLSVQLYCVRSARNWGIGDFSDLSYLTAQAAEQGADFIGLNPIHALYPANPEACSPYGPSSRRWLNYLYIDPEQVPGAEHNDFQSWLSSDDTQSTLSKLRAVDFVDYDGVAALKQTGLELVFKGFNSNYASSSTEQKRFADFIEQGGESLHTLATFEALQSTLKQEGKPYWGWPVFPEGMRTADTAKVKSFAKKHKALVNFFLFLQWQAAEQFEKASAVAKDSGMEIGLYRDLAVGVSEGSAEIWGNQSLYCTDVSVGAPPDILGPLGQKWGLPPMDPVELVNQQYQPIIDLFSSNMKASGALRIDHVMALLRLWWVHKDDNAGDGAYVNYPVDDLLAILALESERNQSLVIGEDLGTVPAAIREKLQQNGMYSYRVFFFEQAEDGGFFSPSHYPEQSMATLTTHDMPTLIGFWHCDDLALGKEVGLYPDQDVLNDLYDIRHENKQHILNTLHGHGSVSENISRDVHHVGMSKELNFGMQTHMATGSSALLSLQLEDWLQMDKPVNIPGTFNEYPNWKRKLSRNLEDIFKQPEIQQLASQLTTNRKQASQS